MLCYSVCHPSENGITLAIIPICWWLLLYLEWKSVFLEWLLFCIWWDSLLRCKNYHLPVQWESLLWLQWSDRLVELRHEVRESQALVKKNTKGEKYDVKENWTLEVVTKKRQAEGKEPVNGIACGLPTADLSLSLTCHALFGIVSLCGGEILVEARLFFLISKLPARRTVSDTVVISQKSLQISWD